MSSRPLWWGRVWVLLVVFAIFWPQIGVKDSAAALFVGVLGLVFSLVFTLFDMLEHRLGSIEVFDGGDHLGLRRGFQKDIVPLSQIDSIAYTQRWPKGLLTLSLKSPSRFGREIAFTVEHMASHSGIHPVAEMLRARLQ
jgi:hypothetical protein